MSYQLTLDFANSQSTHEKQNIIRTLNAALTNLPDEVYRMASGVFRTIAQRGEQVKVDVTHVASGEVVSTPESLPTVLRTIRVTTPVAEQSLVVEVVSIRKDQVGKLAPFGQGRYGKLVVTKEDFTSTHWFF